MFSTFEAENRHLIKHAQTELKKGCAHKQKMYIFPYSLRGMKWKTIILYLSFIAASRKSESRHDVLTEMDTLEPRQSGLWLKKIPLMTKTLFFNHFFSVPLALSSYSLEICDTEIEKCIWDSSLRGSRVWKRWEIQRDSSGSLSQLPREPAMAQLSGLNVYWYRSDRSNWLTK